MCGLVGAVRTDGGDVSREMLLRMTRSLVHRGPDEQGVFSDRDLGLGFQRLAILDLSPNGHQPMRSPDGRYTMVFNGEIFNYVELREELIACGHHFKSSGDTEVLLAAYSQWGSQCLQRLNGMWACLIFDHQKRTLFGSRDRFGIKPLFYARVQDHLLFASEIKALRSSGLLRPEPDWPVAARFMFEGRLDEDDRTFYAGVSQLRPGSYFELASGGELNEQSFWSLDALPPDHADPTDAFADLFEDAVRLRLRSDVPVGVSLSGGLDSTAIICSMARLNGGADQVAPVTAFSFNPAEFDESPYIDATLRQTGARLHRIEIGADDIWAELDTLLWHHDEPVHSATAFVGYKIMQEAARQGVKVMLSGQGADESLAGYANYFAHYWQTLLRSGQWRPLWQELQQFGRQRGTSPAALLREGLLVLLKSELARLSFYRALSRRRRYQALRESRWFSEDFADKLQLEDRGYQQQDLASTLKASVEVAPLPLYLRIEDRNSMANSVESRLPFMDYRLISMAFQTDAKWKLKGSWNKHLLRTAMRGRIPENVRTRPDKFGFPIPVDRWFRSEASREQMQDVLHGSEFSQCGLYQPKNIRKDLDAHFNGDLNAGAQLFDILQFEKWRNGLAAARSDQGDRV